MADLDRRRWADLLSNDPTRLRAALQFIRAEGEAKAWAQQLVHLLIPGTDHSAKHRISAGMALAYLGDPRDFDEIIEIPSGEFLYGEDKESAYVERFRISKYPVTNTQYKRFLDANPEYPLPYLDTDEARPYNWDKEKRVYPEGKANHPVVLVSLEDAKAYCQWAGKRLPTEAEWEKAAQGTYGRSYPWGETFDWAKANTEESRNMGTTPVGVYPDGASPYGVQECAGNVWEWTDSDHEGGGKVVRGGAWNFPGQFASCHARLRYLSSDCDYNLGFRVVE